MRLGLIGGTVIWVLILSIFSGCMQITGMKKAKLGTWEFESNAGFDVSAGVMQYDHALGRKGMNVELTPGGKY